MIKQFANRHPYLLNFLLFLLCVFFSFAMRTHNYNREAESMAKILQAEERVELGFFRKFLPYAYKHFMPYTIECAMMYSYTQDIAAGRAIPEKDPTVRGLEHIPPYSQMIMGLEYFLGYGYRLKNFFLPENKPSPEELAFQENPGLARFLPIQLRLWISLTSGFIFLLLLALGCKRLWALGGGFLHAVAIAAIARSTGQDIIRGNFAMPFIAAFLLLYYSIIQKEKRWKYILLMLSAFGALSFWDFSLGLFTAFAIFELARFALTGSLRKTEKKIWLLTFMALTLSALLIPFNRTYSLPMSPLICVLMPGVLLTHFFAFFPGKGGKLFLKRAVTILLITGGFFLFWRLVIHTDYYASHYSHFSELTKAKIKFNNVKPRNPALLSYDARIMWTPAMHSADRKIIATLFPAPILLTGKKGLHKTIAGFLNFPFSLTLFYGAFFLFPLFSFLFITFRRKLPQRLFFYTFTIVFTIAFIYIVRYHEFLIFFLALTLPMLLQDLAMLFRRHWREKRTFYQKILIRLPATFFVLLLLWEMTISLAGERVYSADVHLKQTVSLIKWLREENVKGKCIITDFTVGPMLKCYADMYIAMQPQFGLEVIRKPTEEFLKALYHGTEKDLAEFCRKYKADYFLHNAGYLGKMHPYSERYIANAPRIKGSSPVNMMKYTPERLRYFHKITPPRKYASIAPIYTIFKFISPEDRIKSLKLTFQAQMLMARGRKKEAELHARSAYLLDPKSPRSHYICRKVLGYIPYYTLTGPEK